MTARPPPPSPAAAGRACAYLRLCGLSPAAARELSFHSMEELQRQFDDWSADLVPPSPGESRTQQRARARAQLLLARVPARWPGQFLRRPPHPGIAAAVRHTAIESKRPLRQTSMTPQPIDLGPVSDVADETWRTFDTWPVLRGLTLWLLFCLLLASVFYVVRF